VPVSARVLPASVGEGFYQRPLHPLHVFLLGAAVSFLVSGVLSDWAYFSTNEIQWKNFASWLILGGLVFAGFALLWALIDLFRAAWDRGRRIIYFLLLLAAWILGFIDELIHAKDAWASMPEALVVSAIVAVLAIAAAGIGLSSMGAGGR
jgi:uncharacterized membrane protein